MNDNIAFIREEARKKGGDELVAKVDVALSRERENSKIIAAMLDTAMSQPEGDERTMAVVAVNEALSQQLGRAAIAHGQLNNVSDAQIMVLAIRSLVQSIQTAVADRDAEKGDVLSLIESAAASIKKENE
jgi:uncharacterized membrane protein